MIFTSSFCQRASLNTQTLYSLSRDQTGTTALYRISQNTGTQSDAFLSKLIAYFHNRFAHWSNFGRCAF